VRKAVSARSAAGPLSRWGSVMVAGLLVLGACGDDDEGGSPSTTTSTTTATASTTTSVLGGSSTTTGATTPATEPVTTPPTLALGPKVGEVVGIVPSGGRADDELVAPGTELRKGSLLAADPAGTVDFKLDQKVKRCQARPASQVRLVADAVLLEFVQGTVWCGTSDEGGLVSFSVGDQLIRANDPVFSVTVGEGGQVEVRVIQGFVQVDGGPTLGEGQRGNRSAQGEAWTVGPFGLGELPSQDENDEGPVVEGILGEVMAGLSPIRYPRPVLERSPTLEPAIGGEPLLVLVVGTGDDPGPANFSTELFGSLVAEQWDVPVDVEVTDEKDALARLEAGEAGIVVTPGAAGGYVPLFEDGQGEVWRAVVNPDDAELRAALEGTIRTALQASCDADDGGTAQRSAPEQSCYEQIYGAAIGGDPVPLSPFAGLLGLG
jgi:hypothetical protein